MGLVDLADRVVDELSGGQRQRAWIALALAQETDLLLLDEPTTFLDLSHQLEVLDLVHSLVHPPAHPPAETPADAGEAGEAGEAADARARTAVVVLHDLNLAARYADHVVAVQAGRVVAAGTPAQVITEQLLDDVFSVQARVLVDPVGGGPLVVPLAGRHTRPRTAAGPLDPSTDPSLGPSQPFPMSRPLTTGATR